jgi:galacturan 1,4-alpha-galacturonidase
MEMKKFIWFALFVFSTVFGQAFPLSNRDICTPASAGDISIDDVPAINKALSTCGNGGTIVIPAGKTFMIRTPVDFNNCSVCDFQIEGTLKVSDDLAYWAGRTTFFMLRNVTGATIRSTTGSGLIDGSGQAYWDYYASNKTYKRPSLLYLSNVSNVSLTNIRLKDAPNVFVSVKDSSVNTKFSELVLSAISTSKNQPLNTDGFNIGDSSYITLSNIQVTNDDDCIAFQSGANYISVQNITCIGSHGLSLGSLGFFAGHTYEVKNVYVSDAKMINSTKAVGIKLYPGGSSHE